MIICPLKNIMTYMYVATSQLNSNFCATAVCKTDFAQEFVLVDENPCMFYRNRVLEVQCQFQNKLIATYLTTIGT